MVTIFKKIYIFPIIIELYGVPCSKQRLFFLLPDGQLVKKIFEKAVTFYRCLEFWNPGGVSFAEEPAITGRNVMALMGSSSSLWWQKHGW